MKYSILPIALAIITQLSGCAPKAENSTSEAKVNMGNGKLKILLTPQNGFYYKDTANAVSVFGYLRGVLEYQTVGNGTPKQYWQNGSLRYTYQQNLPTDLTNSNMQLIFGARKDLKLRVTVTFQVLGGMGNGLVFSLTDNNSAPAQLKINGPASAQYYTLVLESKTVNQAVSFFFSATKATFDANPYFVFSVLIEEV